MKKSKSIINITLITIIVISVSMYLLYWRQYNDEIIGAFLFSIIGLFIIVYYNEESLYKLNVAIDENNIKKIDKIIRTKILKSRLIFDKADEYSNLLRDEANIETIKYLIETKELIEHPYVFKNIGEKIAHLFYNYDDIEKSYPILEYLLLFIFTKNEKKDNLSEEIQLFLQRDSENYIKKYIFRICNNNRLNNDKGIHLLNILEQSPLFTFDVKICTLKNAIIENNEAIFKYVLNNLTINEQQQLKENNQLLECFQDNREDFYNNIPIERKNILQYLLTEKPQVIDLYKKENKFIKEMLEIHIYKVKKKYLSEERLYSYNESQYILIYLLFEFEIEINNNDKELSSLLENLKEMPYFSLCFNKQKLQNELTKKEMLVRKVNKI